ncbi:rho guanine nucleotide exchange factor 10-like isoform X2 [Acanthaster planci]|uniref:Rho guanine nucleotide exchange factor 10-like isoform X2 n=1 Tax=Acanthaster planci TaxID=133434 RepID=A0A8B7XX50_ACAPL|nr:rho guanine nucleotide exchange factor 10-like isoform X2 [Acanthaster planci]
MDHSTDQLHTTPAMADPLAKPSLKPKPAFAQLANPSQGGGAYGMEYEMGEAVYSTQPFDTSPKMPCQTNGTPTQQPSPSKLTYNQSESSTLEVRSCRGSEVSSLATVPEEIVYDDVVIPDDQTEDIYVVPSCQVQHSAHINNSNNTGKSDVGNLAATDDNIYDDVIPPSMAAVDVLKPQQGKSNSEAEGNAIIDANGNAKPRKSRPTNLEMPTVKVAAIVENRKQPDTLSYDAMLLYAADNQAGAVQPRYTSSPRGQGTSPPDPTIYEVECLPGGPGNDQHPNGGESSVDQGWHENEIYEAYEGDYAQPRLSTHFDALECSGEDSGPYEEPNFDEDEQGFFIDDDLLYEDLLDTNEDEEDQLVMEDSDSSWGSEEWEGYSDESDSEMVHSYVIEPNSPQPKRASLDNKTIPRQRSLVTSYGMDRKDEEKPQEETGTDMYMDMGSHHQTQKTPKSYLDWVKEFKGRSNLDKVRNFLFGRHAGPKEEEKEDMDEDKDDIHYIDVKLSQIKHPPPALPPQPQGLTTEQVVRRHVVQSIIDSEKSYMVSLQRLIQAYEKPLLDSIPPLLEKEKVRMIFYRVRGIYQCHLMFQIALSSRVKNWDSSDTIGDVFVASFSKAMVLDVYSAYVNNFTNAMEVAKRAAAQKPAFRNFIETRQTSSIDRLSLYALMLKPIQRFPQFICLLQDLLKRTPAGHSDRMPLQLALTKLETLASVLNERKRQSEQRYAVKQLMKCLNVKISTKFKNDRSRWLIRQDDMLQTTYDSQGEIIKCKERRLFMLNDLLICTTVISKTLSPGLSPGSDMPRCKYRWSVPLSEVEVVEPSGEGGTEVEVSQEPGKLTITTQQQAEEHDYTYTGSARQMYQERNDLMHDMAVVRQIGALLSTLKGSYGTLTKDDVEDWAEIIQKLIYKKGQEIKQADVSKIQLSLPAVAMDKRVTLVFDAVSSKTRLDWVTALETAKLALKSHNNPGWYTSEDSDSAHTEMNYGVPLLMKALPVFTTKQSAKIHCAVLCPLEPAFSRSRRKRTLESEATRNCLWVVSSDNKKSYVSVVSFQPPSPKILETFELGELRVLCAECVPGVTRSLGGGEAGAPGRSFRESVRRSEFCLMKPTVWLGTENGRISIYEASQTDKSQCLVSFKVPRAVTSMKYLNNRMFLAQQDGTVLIYIRTEEGEWKVKEPRISELGSHPVVALLAVKQNMWCGCGNQIHIIDTESEFSQTDFEVHQEQNESIQSMVVAGVGVWVAFQTSDIIRLFHTETLQVLQDISLASPIGRMVAGLSPKSQTIFQNVHSVQVTHLLACYGSLWVGSNLGILVNFPLPRLEGVPLVNGPAMVAYHTHGGPVKFMLGLEINRQSDRIHYSSKDDINEASTPTPTQTPHSTPMDEAPARINPPRTKASAHTANLVTSAMSPMTEYFSLAFDEVDEDDKPSTTDSGACSSNLSEESGRGDLASKVQGQTDRVSASITSTTSLVLCGGEGHNYLMQEGSEGRGREAELLVWQVSM